MGGQSLARCLSLLLAILLVLGVPTVGSGSPFGGGHTPHADHRGNTSVYGVQIDPDTILLETQLRDNGTGLWSVEYRIRLDDENTTQAFEQHREEIESTPESYERQFAIDMRATINNSENSTGREMSLSNVDVDVSRDRLPQEYGVIRYSFQWHGFATVNETTIVAGDALRGMFLDSETTFIITWADRYHREAVAPAPTESRENGIVWVGSLHFTADQPHVVVSKAGEADPNGNPDGSGPGSNSDSGLPTGSEFPLAMGVGVLLLAAVGIAAGMHLGVLGVPTVLQSGGSGEVTGGNELLSNEEQVKTLLEDHDGRLKQQSVADELEWTDAKTSKVIRQLREDGKIETFRIGRENVVTLPDTDPTETNS